LQTDPRAAGVGQAQTRRQLPPERVLSEQLKVSRAALREALRSLEIAGVISLRMGVKGGAFVQAGAPANMTRVMQDLMHLGAISLGDLTEARLLIQSGVVRLACQRATEDDIDALSQNIELTARMSQLGQGEERRAAIADFYRLLALATCNKVLKILVDSITDTLVRFLRGISEDVELPGLIAHRRRFVRYLRARDVEGAVPEMELHLNKLHRLLDRSRQQKVGPISWPKRTEEALLARAWMAVFALIVCAPASAQTWPDKPVKIVLGVPPGGGLDVLVRGVAAELSTKWGQSVVVDNKPGASGLIAAEGIANAAPDGYSLLATTDQIYMGNRYLFKKLPYDPDKSFANITIMARAEQFLIANPSVPASTLSELVAVDKQKPGSLAYGSWGDGSPPQFVYETMNKNTGTKFLHVPYKGVAPVLNGLTGNEVQLSVGSSGVAGSLLRGGKLKALAIAAKERSPLFPNVPTTAEQGYPQVQSFIWFGLAAPAGTPAAVIAKISSDVRDVVAHPAFTERFIATPGWKRIGTTPAETDEVIRTELPIIRDMSAAAGVQPQ
jgi:tripartite-type tricarboxylate transporter receptor subunit TctC/DNA-binding FadR family transcriptional regulator